jgi:hypothetical protein
MAVGRKVITRDMMVAARDKGWNATQTANHYGLHRSSVAAACERFGVELAQSKFNPDMPSTRSRFWKEIVDAATLQPKKKPVFSASPRAVERALEKLQQEKRLQALK